MRPKQLVTLCLKLSSFSRKHGPICFFMKENNAIVLVSPLEGPDERLRFRNLVIVLRAGCFRLLSNAVRSGAAVGMDLHE